jgi:phosphoribosyl 1,2-cyclic phosphodiesterase
MALYFASLNSGSNGNCYYIGNEEEAVLVDVGISCREIEKRLIRSGLAISKIKAVFISHEHSDHIRGVTVLSRKHRIPVYVTPETHKSGCLFLEEDLTHSFTANKKIQVGKLSITAFPKFHDAADPHSFIVTENELTIGVFTDIGMVCENVRVNFKKCHAIFLEANYDEHMLEEGAYPIYLKERIRSDKGHLSNYQALELVLNNRPQQMSHIILSHLSKENNSPKKALELFLPHTGEIKVEVASRLEETQVYCIE